MGNLKDDNILDKNSVAFALRIINAYKYMINEAEYISNDSYISIQADCAELIKLLVSIIKTSRGKS